ncbi:MAG: gliding motility-associated C-terminal domain-containing protein [Saprospiraceae bacterium]|nr:gliding motility-associated C-terminal domain-containing protein [Saprospiraceae bacterium]
MIHRIFGLPSLFILISFYLNAQCPEITSTIITPDCLPSCELCEADLLTIRLTGLDLPNGGKIEYYFSEQTGFNPYINQGSLFGTANISTPGGNCRICPELLGFMIDACGSEAQNEFIILWTGSGFNTSSFAFDFDANNNFGAGNGDIGSTCAIAPGPAGMVSCMATSVGGGYNLPGNAIWIIFTSSSPTYPYDFSAVCGLGLKVFVSKNSCNRSIGAFSNFTSNGIRTQSMTINGCACGATVSYDTDDPALIGEGDAWAGGITNGGCAATISGPGSYDPAISTIDPFTFTIPKSWCGKTYEIVGIVNPKPDPMCCPEIFTERFEISVKCPSGRPISKEICEEENGRGTFILEDYEQDVLNPGGQGTIEWYRNANGTGPIQSPFTSSSTTIFARVVEGSCKSDPIPVRLTVNPLPFARPTSMQLCEEKLAGASFRLSDIISTITGNNPLLKVKFFSDPDLNTEIQSPYFSSATSIYAITLNDKCASKPVEIQLIVYPLPPAKSVGDTLCDLGDGTGIFRLKKLDTVITGGVQVDSILYYYDSLTTQPIKDSLRTSGQMIWVVIYQNPCKSNAIPISLFVRKSQNIPPMDFSQCDDGMGQSTFDLKNVIDSLKKNDPGLEVKFYSDKLLTNPLQPPIQISGSDTIYAQTIAKDCFSESVEIRLKSLPLPKANSVSISICGDVNGESFFDPQSLMDQITMGMPHQIEFYSDSLLNNRITGEILTKSHIFYALVDDGTCKSLPALISVEVIPAPEFENKSDTSVCQYYLIPPLKGRNLSSNASMYLDAVGSGTKLQSGDSLFTSSWIYLIDSTKKCITLDSFYVEIELRNSAGSDTKINICEGSQIDLSQYVPARSTGRYYNLSSMEWLPDSLFSAMGLSGQIIEVLFITNFGKVCGPDTAILEIEVKTKLTVGPDSLSAICNNNLSIDLRQTFGAIDPAGKFFDLSQTGALNGYLWDTQVSGHGRFPIMYWIDPANHCISDTAIFTLLIRPTPAIDRLADLVGCNQVILPPITGKYIQHSVGYYNNPNGSGSFYNPGDTIRQSTPLYIYAADSSGSCSDFQMIQVRVSSNAQMDLIKKDLCPDEFFIIGQNRYDRSRPSGQDTIHALNPNECDTLVNVQLEFLQEAKGNYMAQLCDNDFIIVQGKRYDKFNPKGIEILPSASYQMCDSMVELNLNFHPLSFYQYNPILCSDDSLLIHGQIYHKNNLTGFDTLKGMSYLGCDSVVQITVRLIDHAIFTYRDSLCFGETLQINGRTFDQNNPTAFEILKGASHSFCDSIVDIQIYFLPEARGKLVASYCENDEIRINNTIYNSSHPAGTEYFKGSAIMGCDSILEIDLSFDQTVSHLYQKEICRGDSVLIGRKYYSAKNPMGSDTLKNASHTGCDSVLQIEIIVNEPGHSVYQDLFCKDQFIWINGMKFDIDHPTGQAVLPGSNQFGCDSIIDVNLEFIDLQVTHPIEYTILAREKIPLSYTSNFVPVRIEWTPANGLSCTDCPNPDANPIENTNYTLKLVDENGCEHISSLAIVVRTKYEIYIPNAFSPNQDLVNDHFKIYHAPPGSLLKSMQIYDRWGARIFHEGNVSVESMVGWDGRFKGNPVNPGVYVFQILYQVPGQEEQRLTGEITLIR